MRFVAWKSCVLSGLLWLTLVGAFHAPSFSVYSPTIWPCIRLGQHAMSPSTVRFNTCEQRKHCINLGAQSIPASGADEEMGEQPETPPTSPSTPLIPVEKPKGLKGILKRMARVFGMGKEMPNLKELGMYAILSYGFVSNISYVSCFGVAWFLSSKRSGLSPLVPGQWQKFLVIATGLWAFNNVLRIPRLAFSITLAPTFDRFIETLMEKTGRGKAFATTLCVLIVNLLGTLSFLAASIVLASVLSGVPIRPVPAP